MALQDILYEHMARYGYDRIDTPIVETAELFLTKAGDQIIDRLLTFEHRGHEFALRPEFTATAAKRYLDENRSDVVRWQFEGPIFEDDPASSSTSFQRSSMGAELIGMAGVSTEAEIISMATQGIISSQLSEWQLVIGHVGLLRHLLKQFDLDRRTLQILITHKNLLKNKKTGYSQLLTKVNQVIGNHSPDYDQHSIKASYRPGVAMGGRTQTDIKERLARKEQRYVQLDQIEAAIKLLMKWVMISSDPDTVFTQIETLIASDDSIARQFVDQWKEVVRLLEAYQIPRDRITLNPDLARNWDYYTGIVFGIKIPDGRFVAGGGRYDELIRIISGTRNIPAVGFAYYIDTLMELLPHTLPTTRSPHRIVICLDEDNQQSAARWANALRQHNLHIVLQTGDISDERFVVKVNDDILEYDNTDYDFTMTDVLVDKLKEALQ